MHGRRQRGLLGVLLSLYDNSYVIVDKTVEISDCSSCYFSIMHRHSLSVLCTTGHQNFYCIVLYHI